MPAATAHTKKIVHTDINRKFPLAAGRRLPTSSGGIIGYSTSDSEDRRAKDRVGVEVHIRQDERRNKITEKSPAMGVGRI
jgi:hypothetical protein